jgi:import inner membrane translocase subunit TIM17
MRNSAIGCACLLAVFEGVGIAINRFFAEQNRPLVWSIMGYINE